MGPIIPGRNIETVKEMVNYIYKGKLEDINTHTFIKIFTSTKSKQKKKKLYIIQIHIAKLHKVLKQDQMATQNPRVTTQRLHPNQNKR